MTTDDTQERALVMGGDTDAQLIATDPSTLASLTKGEVEAQLDAAHRYPRSFKRFVNEAMSIAILSQDVAKSCMYSLKRKDKDGNDVFIVGPSIRLAEICASSYGNLHAGARPLNVGDTTVTCQGVAWDVERNVRVVTEVNRRITTRNGRRYGDDMIVVTQNACSSIAFRNAIFRVIPRALVDEIFTRVRQVAAGEGKTMDVKRADIVRAMGRIGVKPDRMLQTVRRARVEDLTIEDIEVLIGLGTRVKDGESVDDVFPVSELEVPDNAAPAAASASNSPRQPLKRPERQSKPTPAAAAATPPAAATTPAAAANDQRPADPDDDRRGDDPDLDDKRRVPPADPTDVPPWGTK